MAEYIEREAAKRYLAFGNACPDGVLDLLDEVPTADVAPVVHGKWENHPHSYGFVRCSVCRDCTIWGEWEDGKKWNYCPNCGAKMDLEEET